MGHLMKKQTYVDFRATAWSRQGQGSNIDFRKSKLADGSELDREYIQPKPILFYKDIWHCRSVRKAKVLIRKLSFMEDVTVIEWKGPGTWVYVDYSLTSGTSHLLPGQDKDERKRLRGL